MVFVDDISGRPRWRHRALTVPTASRRGFDNVSERTQPAGHRRHLPAGDEGSHGSGEVRQRAGYTIVLIGHEGHDEVLGTMGEAPDHMVLVEDEHRR